MNSLSLYLQKHEPTYPGISIWWESKVIPDMASGIKVLYRFDKNLDVQGLGVLDLAQAKICHLSLEHAVRGTGLGIAIFNLMKREARGNSIKTLWCHGPEWIVQDFCRWSNAKPVKTLGTFGRKEIKDIKMEIKLCTTTQ